MSTRRVLRDAASAEPGRRRNHAVKSQCPRLHSKRWISEMAANPGIFVMGEGIGARGGNFGTTRRPVCQIWLRATARYSDLRTWICGSGLRRGHGGRAAHRRFHVHRFHQRCFRRE